MKRNQIVVSALLLTLSAGMAWASEAIQQRQISVVGEASIQVPPSLAFITLGVSDEANEATSAMTGVSKSMVDIIDQLHRTGIDPEDLQTQQISVSPNWSQAASYGSGKQRKITSFTARNTVQLRVRDLGRLGEVLDQALQAGANEFRGLSFGVVDPGAVQDQIRGLAVKEAIRNAEQLAEAAGLQLGRVLSITDHNTGGARPMAMEMARSSAVPVAIGELSFSHNVSVVFGIATAAGD